MKNFPSRDIWKKFTTASGTAGQALTSTITVTDENYAVVYRLWVDIDVGDETDLEALNASVSVQATIGSTDFFVLVHPFIAHTDTTKFRTVDLGPWFYDFGPDGLYSGVKGDDIVVRVGAMGSGIIVRANYVYTGD